MSLARNSSSDGSAASALTPSGFRAVLPIAPPKITNLSLVLAKSEATFGTDVAAVAPLLKGPTVIAYSGDPVAAPKVATDFAKANDKFVILGGAMGNTALNPDAVKALAALPSLDELRAKLIGLVQAPATKIAQLVNAPAAKVARVLQAYADKSEAA